MTQQPKRNKITDQQTQQYEDALQCVLVEMLGIKDQTQNCKIKNCILCKMYDDIPFKQKSLVWSKVGAICNQTKQWAQKRYFNCFSAVKHKNTFDQVHRELILPIIIEGTKTGKKPSATLDEAKRKLEEFDIFPNAIQSFVFQEYKRQLDNKVSRLQKKLNITPRQNCKIDTIVKDEKKAISEIQQYQKTQLLKQDDNNIHMMNLFSLSNKQQYSINQEQVFYKINNDQIKFTSIDDAKTYYMISFNNFNLDQEKYFDFNNEQDDNE